MTMDRVVSDGGTAVHGASTRRMSPPSRWRLVQRIADRWLFQSGGLGGVRWCLHR